MENQLEQLLSTKEVAEQLNTSPKVIIENARKCLPNKVIEHGKTTFWNQAEITILIEQLKTSNPNQSTFTAAVKAVSTELTPALRIRNAMLEMQSAYEEELQNISAKLKKSEQTNALLMHTKHTYTFREIAKELHRHSRGFAEWLHSEGYVYSQNGAWIPYYGKEDLFELKQILINESFSKYTTHITQKGRCELLKKYGGNSIG